MTTGARQRCGLETITLAEVWIDLHPERLGRSLPDLFWRCALPWAAGRMRPVRWIRFANPAGACVVSRPLCADAVSTAGEIGAPLTGEGVHR